MRQKKIDVGGLQWELKEFEKELEHSPEGHLGRKGASFYQVLRERQLGITKNPELVRQLSRKKYLQARIADLTKNFSKSMGEFALIPPKELIAGFSAAYQQVPLDYFYHPTLKDWKEKQIAPNTFHLDEVKYGTFQEGAFRSMSERVIAEILDRNELPYHYDKVVGLGYKKVSPDFIIKNPFTGKTFLWEHFGAFNDPKYADAMNAKLDTYLSEGFSPFENLICSYEYHLRQPQRIQDLIEQMIF